MNKAAPHLRSRALLLGLLASIQAASKAAPETWQPLFDGATLEGWERLGGEATYEVEGGAIVGTSVADTPNTFLATKKAYGDFVLEFEFKVESGLNSGVQFRSQSREDYRDGRVHGYQYEIDTSDRAWTAGIFDEARRGWLYPVDYNPPARQLFKPTQWNQGRIECYGQQIKTYLNGQLVSFLIDGETERGFIALQVHSVGRNASLVGKQVSWRNLRLKELTAPPSDEATDVYIRNAVPNSLAEPQEAQGWISLFDGKQLHSFRSVHGGPVPEFGWTIGEGALTIQATPKEQPKAGDIVTRDTYSAFEFELEFKLSEGANSGIKYYFGEYRDSESGKPAKVGLEYQILDDERHPDAKRGTDGNRTCASLYDMIASADRVHGRNVPLRLGDWNLARVVALPDGSVQHWLNGFKVLEYQRGSDRYHDLVKRSKYRIYENFGLAKSGRLLLQDHNDRVSFRSIRLRPID